jgi:hypothetical protein
MTGIATATEAGPSGSDGGAQQPFRKPKAAGFRRLFSGLARRPKAGKNPLALLDNRGSLC